MYPRKPLPFKEQHARLKAHLRRARHDLQRKYEEYFAATKGRRDCPLEVSIKRRSLDCAETTVKLIEIGIEDLRMMHPWVNDLA